MSKFAFLLPVVFIATCDSPMSQDAPPFDVRGTWEYHGSQTSPELQIVGSLHITERSGTSFTGTATFTETDVQSTRHTRAGALSGRFVGSSVLDFDIQIDARVRRHVARVSADSIVGSWSVSDAAAVNGWFRASRLP